MAAHDGQHPRWSSQLSSTSAGPFHRRRRRRQNGDHFLRSSARGSTALCRHCRYTGASRHRSPPVCPITHQAGRNPVTRADKNPVSDDELVDGDFHFLSVSFDKSCFRLEPGEFFDSLRCLPFGPGLQKLPQENKGDDDHGSVEIDMRLDSPPS